MNTRHLTKQEANLVLHKIIKDKSLPTWDKQFISSYCFDIIQGRKRAFNAKAFIYFQNLKL